MDQEVEGSGGTYRHYTAEMRGPSVPVLIDPDDLFDALVADLETAGVPDSYRYGWVTIGGLRAKLATMLVDVVKAKGIGVVEEAVVAALAKADTLSKI